MNESKVFTVQTINFGAIDIPLETIIHFDEGIPGFPQIRKFAILEFEHLKPFQYLQSLDDPPIALLVVNPFLFKPAYEIELGETDKADLKAERPEEVSVFVVATIPENPAEATLNLMAPILINLVNRCGKQVILLDSNYSVRHPLLESSQCNDAETV